MAIDRSSQNWPDTVEVSDETRECAVCGKPEKVTHDAHGNTFTDFAKHAPVAAA